MYASGDLGFPGFQIGSHVGDWNLDAKELYPIYKVHKIYYGLEVIGISLFKNIIPVLKSKKKTHLKKKIFAAYFYNLYNFFNGVSFILK